MSNRIRKMCFLSCLFRPYLRFSLLVTVAFIVSSCMTRYPAASRWEQQEIARSDFKIQPEQVREEPEKYADTQVAWMGIIREAEFYENPDHYQVLLLLEHRYFDQRLSIWDQPAIFYPSRYGEGNFQTEWYLKKSADLDYFMKRFGEGNWAIVYATPETVVDRVILLKSRYIRVIDNEYVRSDVSDYIP